MTNRREIIPERNRVWKKRIEVTVGASKWPNYSEYKEALRTLTGILRCIKGAVHGVQRRIVKYCIQKT